MDNLRDFYKGKKVFITGHTGFKGSWLCEVLKYCGAAVYGYSLEPPTAPNLYSMLDMSHVCHTHGDVRNLDSLRAAMREVAPEIVIHMAAQPLVRESYVLPVDTYETNVMGTVNLLEAVRQTSSVVSVVNVTTDKVYENREWIWGYRENENLCGHDPYSNSKSCSELVTASYRRSFFAAGPAVSTARSGNVIGGGDFAHDRIIPDCIRAAERGAPVILRNPHSIRPYQHVLECLRGYLMLACKQYEDKNKYEGSYNFGPAEYDCVTTENLVQLFCEAWGDGMTWRSEPQNGPHEATFLKLDCSKAASVLAWHPMMNIKSAVTSTVQCAKRYSDLATLRGCVSEQVSNNFV